MVVGVSDSQVEIAMIGEPDEQWFKEVDARSVQRTNIPTKVSLKFDNVAEELKHLLAYSDADFEEWRELVMPQLQRYLFSLEPVAETCPLVTVENGSVQAA